MNSSTETKEHVRNLLTPKRIGSLLPILESSKMACDSFFARNSDFFDTSQYFNNIKGDILTYSLSRSLRKSFEQGRLKFGLRDEKITPFGYTVPVLFVEDISLSFIRANKRFSLGPSEKKYLQKKSQGNRQLYSQLELFEQILYKDSHLHGTILYGIGDQETVAFADILFWDESLKYYYWHINLKKELVVYEANMTEDEESEALVNANDIVNSFEKAFCHNEEAK